MQIAVLLDGDQFGVEVDLNSISHALDREDIALEEVGDGIWNIVYYSTLLGKIDERTSRITGI